MYYINHIILDIIYYNVSHCFMYNILHLVYVKSTGPPDTVDGTGYLRRYQTSHLPPLTIPAFSPATVAFPPITVDGIGIPSDHHRRYRPSHRPPSMVPAFPPAIVDGTGLSTVDGTGLPTGHRRRWVAW